MEGMIRDVRYAIQMLLRHKTATLVAILSIMLGIAANTVVFTAINAILLKSLPYKDPSRIVVVWGTTLNLGSLSERDQVSATDTADLRKQASSFEEVSTFTGWMPLLTGAGTAERIPAMQVGDGFFGVMQGKPLLGRVFLPEEQKEGKDFVIVIGYGLWQRHFGQDPDIVGKKAILNGRTYTIVGVMPADFHPLPANLSSPEAEFYRPVAEAYDNSQRDARHLRAIARLKPGVALTQAQAEVTVIAKQLERSYPQTNTAYGWHLVTITDDTVGRIRPSLMLLFGAVLFVLIIACVNVGNLLLVRASARRKEITIRAAMGASRSRMLRQLLTESIVLAVTSGILGALLAYWGIGAMRTWAGAVSPLFRDISMDFRVLGFTFLISILTGIGFGIVPAFSASNPNLAGVLKESGAAVGGSGGNRLRKFLVAGEIAITVVLLLSAGLFIQTMMQLRQVNPGFNEHNVLTMSIGVPAAKYPETADLISFYDRLLSGLQSIPGAESAGIVSVLPLSDNFDGRGVLIEDHPKPPGQEYTVDMYVASPGYLRALQIPLIKGRGLEERDTEKSMLVMLINERMAQEFWPNQDPIGKRIKVGTDPNDPETQWRTIVGIVRDVSQYALVEKPPLQMYVPSKQFASRFNSIVVKTTSDPVSMFGSVRKAILAVDPDQAVYNIATMDQLLSKSIGLQHFLMVLLIAFAGLAVLLAAIGIYGVMSYDVSQRTREIGIRMALGAQRKEVLNQVLGNGMKLAVIGVVAGCAAALFATRLVVTFLFQVSPTNVANFLVVSLIVLVVAAAACLIPGIRAARTNPLRSLRHE